MKNALFGLIAIAAMTGLSASAVVRPIGTEIPVYQANLTELEASTKTYPRVMSIVMNKKDGQGDASSFVMNFDSGIRCIMAPCPSYYSVVFNVQKATQSPYGTVEYVATEKLENIPPHVRIAAKRLKVVDYTNDLREIYRPYTWVVTLAEFGSQGYENRFFGGKPEPVYTIQ